MGDQQEEVTERRKKVEEEEEKRAAEGSSSGGMEGERRVAMVVSNTHDHTSPHHQHPHPPCRVYPSPLLSHVDVSTDTAAFFDALQKFHSAMGTRFMVPVIGGKELNLHQLYVQVTQRGGLEKVIMERMWREVIATFNFPPTTTSASFVLRKYYLNLLYHFEQVYFFRAQGPLIPPSGILQTKTPLSKLDPGLHHSSSVSDSTMRRKMAIPLSSGGVVPLPPQTVNGAGYVSSGSSQRFPAAGESIPATGQHLLLNGHGSGVGASGSVPIATGSGERIPTGTHSFTVAGTIDGKFEHGYFVTVKIGSQVLHGVLYHVHPETSSYSSLNQANHQPPGAPSSSAPVSSTAIVPYIPPTRSVRRRLRHRNRDPSHPKPNRSAYNFFFAEKHSKLKALYPHQERQYSRMIGESWSKLTEEEKKVYDDYGKRDKDRYRRELQEYKERLRLVSLRDQIVRPMDVVREDAKIYKEVKMMKEVEMGESSEVKNGD